MLLKTIGFVIFGEIKIMRIVCHEVIVPASLHFEAIYLAAKRLDTKYEQLQETQSTSR